MKEIDAPIQPHGMTALEFAIEHLDLGAARKALTAGANPNRAGRNGVCPLHWSIDIEMEEAIYQYDTTGIKSPPGTAMTELLLEFGANPKMLDDFGASPLDWAKERGHEPALVLMSNCSPRHPN